MSDKAVLEWARMQRRQMVGMQQMLSILDKEIDSRVGIPPELIEKEAKAASNYTIAYRLFVDYYESKIKEHEKNEQG